MKRLALAGLAVLLPACTSTASPPSPQSPSPTVSPSAVVTPVAAPVPATFSPRSASFVSTRLGWVLGTTATPRVATVVVTRDGGSTWSAAGTIPVQVGADLDGRPFVQAIRFLSDTVGWAYGSKAYVTRDGGATWREVAMPGRRTLVSIAASGTETYALLGNASEYVVSDGAVWKGTVGGDTFTRADTSGVYAPIEDLVVRGRTVLFETDRAFPGRTYRVSNDAGRTWTTRTPCPDGDLRDVTASTERDLVFLCDARFGNRVEVRVSGDGGRTTTLRRRETGPSGTIAAATPTALTRTVDSREVLNATLQSSVDGGRTFRDIGPVEPATARDQMVSWGEPRYVDATFGTILRRVASPSGVTATLYVTRDSGATWTRLAIQ